MTPNEERKIEKKEKTAWRVSLLIAVLVGFVALAIIPALDDDESDTEPIYYLVGFVVLVVSSFLIGRIYRKHLEQKLGRRLKSEYELTSLTSWMAVSKKDTSQELKETVRGKLTDE